MAQIKVNNATVTRIIPNYGFKASSEVKLRNGETKKELYTVWTDEQVKEGDVVNVSGLLSVKVEEFENKLGELVKYAAIHVNNAKVEADAPF